MTTGIYRRIKGLITIFVALPILAACSGADTPTGIQTTKFLAHVPADTPYLYVSNRPLPDKLASLFLQSIADQLSGVRKRLQAETADHSGDIPVLTRVMLAIFAELDGKISRDGLAGLGIPVDGPSIIYGLGILPVVRKQISDPARVTAFIRRVERRSGVEAPRKSFQGQEYLRFSGPNMIAVVAVTETEIIAALLPPAMEQQLLPVLFGEEKPLPGTLDSAGFRQFLSQHRFKGYGDGYLDLVRLTDIVLGDTKGTSAAIWQALGVKLPAITPACKQLTKYLAASVPRWASGVTEADAHNFSVHTRLETSSVVGAHLQNLTAAAPRLSDAQPSLFVASISLLLPTARDGIKDALLATLKRGKDCEWVDEKQITNLMLSLDILMNPMLAGVKGVEVQLHDLTVDPDDLQLTGVDAQLLLAVDDPKGVFGMAGMFNPELARVRLPDDGTPVSVDLGDPTTGAATVLVAAKDDLLVVATDTTAARGVNNLLSAPVRTKLPIFGVAYDVEGIGQRLRPLLEKRVTKLKAKGDATNLGAVKNALDTLNRLAESYRRISLSVRADVKGISLDMNAEFH